MALENEPVKTKVTGNEAIANRGHRRAFAQEVQHVRSSTMTKVEEKGKADMREVSNRTGRRPSGKERRHLFSVTRKADLQKTRIATAGILHSAFLHKKRQRRSGTNWSLRPGRQR